MRKNLNSKIKELAAVAVISPGLGMHPFEMYYFQQIELPVIAVTTYAVYDLSVILKNTEFDKYQQKGTIGRKLTDLLVPHWAYEYNGEKVYPVSPLFLLIVLLSGVKRTLTLGDLRTRFAGGCLPSERDKALAGEYGPIPVNWQITGDISSDKLMQDLENRKHLLPLFFKRYNFVYTKTLAFDLHWYNKDHLEQLLRIGKFAGTIGWNVIFCPKPGIDRNRIELCEQSGFAVSQEPTLSVLPMVDLYVSIESLTCLWAAQAGIPTLSIGLLGCVGVTQWKGSKYYDPNDAELFYKELQILLEDKCKYKEMRRMAQNSSHQHGILDGKCNERIRDYIIEIIQSASTNV